MEGDIKMNKDALVQRVSEEFVAIQKKEMDKIVSCVFDIMKETLSEDESLEIAGFGKFVVNERKEHMGINPVTKEKMMIPASKYVKFTSSKQLKEAVKK